jgi:hypothetical protein
MTKVRWKCPLQDFPFRPSWKTSNQFEFIRTSI